MCPLEHIMGTRPLDSRMLWGVGTLLQTCGKCFLDKKIYFFYLLKIFGAGGAMGTMPLGFGCSCFDADVDTA